MIFNFKNILKKKDNNNNNNNNNTQAEDYKNEYSQAKNKACKKFTDDLTSTSLDNELEDLMVKWINNYEDIYADLIVGIYHDQVNEEEDFCAIELECKIHTEYATSVGHYIYISRILEKFKQLEDSVSVEADRIVLIEQSRQLLEQFGKQRGLILVYNSDEMIEYPNNYFKMVYKIEIPNE